MKKSYYIIVEDRIEWLKDVEVKFVRYSDDEYQIMWSDSIAGEGSFCFDYVERSSDSVENANQLIAFLDHYLSR